MSACWRPSMAATDPGLPGDRSSRWRRWLVNIGLVLLILGGVQWWQARPLAKGEAPPLAGLDQTGAWVDLRDLGGEPVLVHFWASWCPVCRAMDGFVDAIARDHRVLTVALQSGEAGEILSYLRAADLDFPVMPDPDGGIARRWGVGGVPASFVIDPEGRIASATVGLSTEPGLRLRLWAAKGEETPPR
ncbi:MAG: protein disulfide oxidoreductase [Chromatiaceae bacterium]|nr:protein disulfide oxidoreductase [Chromatiaceae bacterium]